MYNGLAVMRDDQTRSRWEHICGECFEGPLQSYVLEQGEEVQHLTARETLNAHPDAMIAISRPSFRETLMRFVSIKRMNSKQGFLPFFFYFTMGKKDTRREHLEMGIGVRPEKGSPRFYPLSELRARNKMIFDTLNERSVLVYVDPVSALPDAIYTQAKSAEWNGSSLVLDTGETIQNGSLYKNNGDTLKAERPWHLVSRWYGFSYTFPGCDIYQGY